MYGMTCFGGTHHESGTPGTIFSIQSDGTYTKLYDFGSIVNDGYYPHSQLTLSGNYLYGMTTYGFSDNGAIFKMKTDGTGYEIVRPFSLSTGSRPLGSLTTADGSTFYGMTTFGGIYGYGVAFSIDASGTDYTVLHQFRSYSYPTDGSMPYGNNLLIAGNTLYGMTYLGGPSTAGTIFSMEIDGDPFTVLHAFSGGTTDGAEPYGSLVLSNNNLYGMTRIGGTSNKGIIFAFDLATQDYSWTYSFAGTSSDGALPQGSLVLAGDTLYGMTGEGGANNRGTIFSIKTDGSNYTVLHDFNGSDGSTPRGDLTLNGGTLYGMTESGGLYGGGTVFSLETTEYRYIENSYSSVGLDFDSRDINLLAGLYFDGKSGGSPSPIVVDGLTWEYFSGSVAGHSLGDAWIENGIYYFYLGSGVASIGYGVEGSGGTDVPEPSTLLLLLPFVGFAISRTLKKSTEVPQ